MGTKRNLIAFRKFACAIIGELDDEIISGAQSHARFLLEARTEAAKKTASKRTLSTDPKAVAKREAMRKWRAKG